MHNMCVCACERETHITAIGKLGISSAFSSLYVNYSLVSREISL